MIFSFFESDLLKDIVFACDSLFLFEQQVVSTGHLVVLVVQDKSGSLFEVVPSEMVSQLVYEF